MASKVEKKKGSEEGKVLCSEVEKDLDLSIIRYSRVVEDCRVLSKALNIKPDVDVVLSIIR